MDCGDYWQHLHEQGSEPWSLEHHLRVTASSFAAAIGKSSFSSPLDVAANIVKIRTQICDKNSRKHGIVTEPEARNHYIKTKGIFVQEVGLAVPKWEPRIGTSVDGIPFIPRGISLPSVDEIPSGTNGIIEIKCPEKMYRPLQEYIDKRNAGWVPEPGYHAHIHDTHYCQMQGSMKIRGADWCDYYVYATGSNAVYTERVRFNPRFWDDVLGPGLDRFLDEILEPLIQQTFARC